MGNISREDALACADDVASRLDAAARMHTPAPSDATTTTGSRSSGAAGSAEDDAGGEASGRSPAELPLPPLGELATTRTAHLRQHVVCRRIL